MKYLYQSYLYNNESTKASQPNEYLYSKYTSVFNANNFIGSGKVYSRSSNIYRPLSQETYADPKLDILGLINTQKLAQKCASKQAQGLSLQISDPANPSDQFLPNHKTIYVNRLPGLNMSNPIWIQDNGPQYVSNNELIGRAWYRMSGEFDITTLKFLNYFTPGWNNRDIELQYKDGYEEVISNGIVFGWFDFTQTSQVFDSNYYVCSVNKLRYRVFKISCSSSLEDITDLVLEAGSEALEGITYAPNPGVYATGCYGNTETGDQPSVESVTYLPDPQIYSSIV